MWRSFTKLAAPLAAAGLAAGLILAGPGTARATDFPAPGQWAEIFNPYLHAQGNTLCFDDPSGSTSDGTQAQLYRCHGYTSNGAPQRWVFVQHVHRMVGAAPYHPGQSRLPARPVAL